MSCNIGLILLYGLPGSGKTTLCRTLNNNNNNNNNNETRVIIIEEDEFLLPLLLSSSDVNANQSAVPEHFICTSAIFHKAKELFHNKVRSMMHDLSTSSGSSDAVVFVVSPLPLRSMRRAIWRLVRDHNTTHANMVAYGEVFLNTDVDTCIQQNSRRVGKERVPDRVIKRMAATWDADNEKDCMNDKKNNQPDNLEYSTTNGGIKKAPLLIINTITLETLSHITSFINLVLCQSEDKKPKNIARHNDKNEKDPSSIIHSLDITLRKLVNAVVQEKSDNKASMKGLLISKERRRLLADAKRKIKNDSLHDTTSISEKAAEELIDILRALD